MWDFVGYVTDQDFGRESHVLLLLMSPYPTPPGLSLIYQMAQPTPTNWKQYCLGLICNHTINLLDIFVIYKWYSPETNWITICFYPIPYGFWFIFNILLFIYVIIMLFIIINLLADLRCIHIYFALQHPIKRKRMTLGVFQPVRRKEAKSIWARFSNPTIMIWSCFNIHIYITVFGKKKLFW